MQWQQLKANRLYNQCLTLNSKENCLDLNNSNRCLMRNCYGWSKCDIWCSAFCKYPFQLSNERYYLGLSTFLYCLGLSDSSLQLNAKGVALCPLLVLHFFFASIPSVSLQHVSSTTTVLLSPSFSSLSSDVGSLTCKRHWPGTFIVANACPLASCR